MRGIGVGFAIVAAVVLGAPCAAAWPGLASAPLPSDPTPQSPNAVRAAYSITIESSLESLDVHADLTVFEAEVRGQGVPAQALRDGGPVVRDAFESAVRQRVLSELQGTFAPASPLLDALAFDYGASDADGNPYEPPIRIVADARVSITPSLLGLQVPHLGAEKGLARAFLFSGGSVTVDRRVPVDPGFDARVAINVPSTLRLEGSGLSNQSRLEFGATNMRGTIADSVLVHFSLRLDPNVVPANVRDGPVIDAVFVVRDETPLWQEAIPFSTGRYAADLDLWIRLPSLSVSSFAQDPLPGDLHLTMVSADLLRVAMRSGLVSEHDVHAYFADLITKDLQDGFGKAARIQIDEAAFQHSVASPIGGADGHTVAPLLIHATADLPLRADKVPLGSSLGRTLGMIVGVPGSFPLANDGSWTSHVTVLYPKGVQMSVRDSKHLTRGIERDGHDGFTVTLRPGDATEVHVRGRPATDPWVFLIGLLELGTFGVFVLWAVRRIHRRLLERRLPWGPRGW